MNAATPGQAAYEAFQLAFPGEDWGSWALCGMTDEENQPGWERIGQAAIDVFLAGDSVSAESIREALAAQDARPAPAHGKRDPLACPCCVFGDDDCWCRADCGAGRCQARDVDTQSAPGPDVCECGHYWAHHAFSDDVCAVVDCPCTRPRPAPKPAPELAAAMTEGSRYLEALEHVRAIILEGDDSTEGSRLRRSRAVIRAALEGK